MSDTQTSLTSQTGIQNNSNSLEPSNNNSLQCLPHLLLEETWFIVEVPAFQ